VTVARIDLTRARGHWVDRATLLWDAPTGPGLRYSLHYSGRGALHPDPRGVAGGQSLTLLPAGSPSEAVRRAFPHLAGLSAFALAEADQPKVAGILKGQVVLAARDAEGRLIEATGVQISGVLDDLYPCAGTLGPSVEGDSVTLRVWAPTARSVTLRLSPATTGAWRESVAMTGDPATGVWQASGGRAWLGRFYAFEVEVFVPATGRVEINLVTDPYSLGLSANSQRSQIVDLADPTLMPPGWRELQKPPLDGPEAAVLYELHVRDFSIRDLSVAPAHRGRFLAFTDAAAAGMRHLRALAAAGLTHVHLLPVFDFATVNDLESERLEPDAGRLAALPGDSPEQAALVEEVKDKDGFNWGYDPFHYTVPEGSYATDPEGSSRILEFREMVAALSRAGLRVVMDVVYNHTFASGQDERSVLDRIVPGYYHRLNAEGVVEKSTCCANTASEHAVMRRLMVDSVVTWAKAYKVDGFRFDLMGHHMVDDMLAVRSALDALTLEHDGVAGGAILMYGEGWDFGEVAGGARGRNATQANVGGTGIGVFNDRLRDAARGGGAFSGLQDQGFITGLFDDPNDATLGAAEEQRSRLLRGMDLIRLGLAGNLRDYRFVTADGQLRSGAEIDYGGRPAGFALAPQENVVYVAAHDNETLFDAVQLKASASTSLDDRVRMNNLGVSLVLLAQGLPFLHAGDEFLRSKSLDRNSYNSGDWWNALDFSGATGNWAVGLPPGENRKHWPLMARLLADPRLYPGLQERRAALAHAQEMLRVRRSTRLFRLGRSDEIQKRLFFGNVGLGQRPGVIVMTIDNSGDARLEDPLSALLVVVNACRGDFDSLEPSLKGVGFELHPVLAASADPATRSSRFEVATGGLFVPGRTTAVFVLRSP
jgi:pullulanase